MLVYMATNKINNKVYIGQTIRTMVRRKACHLSDARKGSNLCLHRAIRKYGAGNFTWEVIYRTDNFQDLNAAEAYLIAEYNSRIKGYNVLAGGDNHIGFTHTADARARISAAMSGEKHPRYDKAIYTFYHKEHGEVSYTQNEFGKRFGIGQGRIYDIVHGNRKSAGGWAMSKTLATISKGGNFDKNIYTFCHKEHGSISCTQYDLRIRFGLDSRKLPSVISGKRKSVHGWSLSPDSTDKGFLKINAA